MIRWSSCFWSRKKLIYTFLFGNMKAVLDKEIFIRLSGGIKIHMCKKPPEVGRPVSKISADKHRERDDQFCR